MECNEKWIANTLKPYKDLDEEHIKNYINKIQDYPSRDIKSIKKTTITSSNDKKERKKNKNHQFMNDKLD